MATVVVGGVVGCAESLRIDEKEEARKAARVARENARLRQSARRRALKVQRRIGRDLVIGPSTAASCEERVVTPLRPVQGVLPVACGNFEAAWPLTAERGFLRCEVGTSSAGHRQRRVVFSTSDGTEYALSEDARWVGYPRIAPIFREDVQARRYDNVLTREGLKLCGGGAG